LIGMLLLAAAVTAPSAPTLGQWAREDAAARRLSMVGAMEGMLLAASGPDGTRIPVNPDCFSSENPESLEKGLLARARTTPSLPLAEGLLRHGSCAFQGATQ